MFTSPLVATRLSFVLAKGFRLGPDVAVELAYSLLTFLGKHGLAMVTASWIDNEPEVDASIVEEAIHEWMGSSAVSLPPSFATVLLASIRVADLIVVQRSWIDRVQTQGDVSRPPRRVERLTAGALADAQRVRDELRSASPSNIAVDVHVFQTRRAIERFVSVLAGALAPDGERGFHRDLDTIEPILGAHQVQALRGLYGPASAVVHGRQVQQSFAISLRSGVVDWFDESLRTLRTGGLR
jgi:hypothetical protein